MFQLLPCSNCQRTFSIRQQVSERALLKCPSCGNQFRLGDVLDAYYSPWLILENPEASLADQQSDEDALTAIATRMTDDGSVASHRRLDMLDAELELDAELSGDEFNAREVEPTALVVDQYPGIGEEDDLALISPADTELDVVGEFGTAASPDIDPKFSTGESDATGKRVSLSKSRLRRPESSGIWSVIQVVLGGAAAIPVTLLLLWYVLGKDVMDAGPTVAQYVPWIVPQKFRNTYEAPEPLERPRSTRQPPAAGESGFRNFDDVLPPKDVTSSAAELREDSVSESMSTEQAPSEINVDPTSKLDVPDKLLEDTGMTKTFEALAAIKKKIADYDPKSTDNSGKVRQITAMFDDLSVISEQLSTVPATGGAVKLLRNELREIGRSVTAEPDLEKFFKLGVRAQFDGRMPRSSKGRVFLGTFTETSEENGDWRLRHVESQVNGYILEVDAPKAVAPNVDAEQLVFVLGTIVEDAPGEKAASTAPKTIRVSATFLQTL